MSESVIARAIAVQFGIVLPWDLEIFKINSEVSVMTRRP